MKLLSKAPVYLFIITLIIITAMYYESNFENDNLTKNNGPTPKSVTFLIGSMELIINNENGSHRAVLTSPKVKHIPEQSATLLYNPILILNQDDAHWKVTAKTGKIVHNVQKIKQVDKIILSGNVIIKRNSTQKAVTDKFPFLNLMTDEIIYTPSTDLITSDKKVTIVTKESKTTAIGMKFNKTNQKLELLSQVKSVYNAH